MHQWDEMFNLPYDSALAFFRVLSAFLIILIYAHISACIQFMVPMVLQFPKDTWVRTRGLHDNNVTSTVAQYKVVKWIAKNCEIAIAKKSQFRN